MPPNLDRLRMHLRTFYEPAKPPYEIFDPTKPQLIRINKPSLYISGVVGGGKFSTDAVGIASPNETDARITIIDGQPAVIPSEQQREFAITSHLAQQIAESPLGSWPKGKKLPLRGSITTDIHSINNGNYLVGSIGSMDNFSFAFVPNGTGTFDRTSFRLIYANPLVDPKQSHIDPTTGDTNPVNNPNPLILPKGSIVMSSTFGGLDEIAKLYGLEKSFVMDRLDELKDAQEMERAYRSFFRPFVDNLEKCGSQIINEITAHIQKKSLGDQLQDVGMIFALLDDRITVPRRYLPIGQEFLLLDELGHKDYKREPMPNPYSPQIKKYGVEQIRDLIDHLILNNLTDTQVFANANGLLPAESLSHFAQTWLEEKGASIKRTNPKKHFSTLSTSPLKSAQQFLSDQNKQALRGMRGSWYAIDGYGQQLDISIQRERTYSLEFHDVLNNDVPAWFQERKDAGYPLNVLDLMGQGLIEGMEKADSITGVALSKTQEHPYPNSSFIRGNVYHPRVWKQIEKRAKEFGGYDAVFCRPMGAFDFQIESYDYENQIKGQLLILKSLLERTYKLLNPYEGTMLFTLPKFSTLGIGGRNAMNANIYVHSAMQSYFEALTSNGFDVVPGETALSAEEKGAPTRYVYKIVRHASDPSHLELPI